MDLIQAVILGAVQGITEFLPVSSSGHLVLFQKLFSIKEPPVFFDAILHFASLLAVLFYFRKYLASILKDARVLSLIVIGTVPVVIVGFLIKDKIEQVFNSLLLLSFSFLITSLILFSAAFFKKQEKNISAINWKDALFIGIFQAIAILPGVSRSGATISAGIFRKMDRESAFRFSFLLFIPAILGAMVLQVFELDNSLTSYEAKIFFAGFLASLIFGILSLKLLERVLIKGKFSFFAVYCFILGVLILILE